MMYMSSMHRTQVYLTPEEHKALKALAKRTGRSFSATLRDAIDAYISRYRNHGLKDAIEASFGCWRDRGAEMDLRTLREEWEVREARQK